MIFIHIGALFGIILFLFCLKKLSIGPAVPEQGRPITINIFLLIFIAFILRLICAFFSDGFDNDTACFASWADRIFQTGPAGFYSPDVFTDYPPGYMYLLYPIGALRRLFQIPYYSRLHLVLLKLPPILCDLGCGWLLYREAGKKCSPSQAVVLCAAYLFNPAIVLNSSLWGQVDAVFILPILYMCLSLTRGKLVPAYISVAAAFLIKPQALFLAPVLLAAMIDQLILKDFSGVRLLKNLAYGVITLCGTALLCAPFGLENVWEQYFSTVSSYPYASVNAYNFWTLSGLNWASQSGTFMGIPYYIYGFVAIFAAVTFVILLGLHHREDMEKYPLMGAFLVTAIFVFSVRMHERYLYPAIVLLLLAYLYKPSRQLYFCYGGLSLLHFYNTAHVLYFYDPHNYNGRAPILVLVSLGTLAMACFLCQVFYKLYGFGPRQDFTWDSAATAPLPVFLSPKPLPVPRPSRRRAEMKAVDFVIMFTVTALYSAFALYDLGDRLAPVSTYEMSQGDSISLDFGEEAPVTLSYYIAPWHNRVFSLEGKRRKTDEWVYLGEITLDKVFTWQELTIEAGVPYLRLTLKDSQASLIELVFLNESGTAIVPVNREEYAAIFDEQSLKPDRSTFRNSMYFDEIYHARTAYEFLKGLYSYENTHPPLGKIFIALGIALFGMNPFGWRIVGTLFGIAMVPLVYLFAKRLTNHTPVSALACVLFTFDFMHFAQTRIATIDVYITFFVILMYYFMYQYSTMSFYDKPLWKTFLPLGACGFCMGLGIASKWTGIYAGMGLAIVFFATLYRRYREYLYALKEPDGASRGIPHRRILEQFVPCTRKTIFFCMLFFVLIPGLIYLLSYLPFKDNSNDGLFLRMLHNQTSMFRYHSTLDATHPYSSPWYQWPVVVRPIWYFSGYPGETLREGISAFGNPLVWWAGIPAFFYLLWLWGKKRDRNAAFLSIGYLAQYLPWVFVSRITFIYHYFPSVIFVVLMIVYSLLRRPILRISDITEAKKKEPPSGQAYVSKQYSRHFLIGLVLYGTAAFGLFLLFYPVLSGQPVEADFVNRWLRWFDSWVLTGR